MCRRTYKQLSKQIQDETSEHLWYNQNTDLCVIMLTGLTGHDLGTFCFSMAFRYISLNILLQQLSGGKSKGIFLYSSPSFLKNSTSHWKDKDVQEHSVNESIYRVLQKLGIRC